MLNTTDKTKCFFGSVLNIYMYIILPLANIGNLRENVVGYFCE